MSLSYPVTCTTAHGVLHTVRLLGVNDADPTKEVGPGITVSRTAEGVYKVLWNYNPGTFVTIVGYCFGDTTPADVKGYTMTRDTVDTTTPTAPFIAVSTWDSSFAAADIVATGYLDITFLFATVS